MIAFINTSEDRLKTIPFSEQSIYFCSDSKNFYFDDTILKTRIKMGDIISVSTYSNLPIAPIPNKIYLVEDMHQAYFYDLSIESWVSIGGYECSISPFFSICQNMVNEEGIYTVNNASTIFKLSKPINSVCKATFIPDSSITDLYSDEMHLSCTCLDENVLKIKFLINDVISPLPYPLIGHIMFWLI